MPISPQLLKKIASAKASVGGNIIRDGRYAFEIRRMLIDLKRSGTMFIVELNVIESAENEQGIAPNKAGTTASYVVNLDKNESAPGNTKAFVLALLGAKEEETNDDDLMATIADLCSEKQPARGMLIGDTTFRKPIQKGPNAGKPFVGHNWNRIEQTAEQIAARRAALDAAEKKAAA